MNKVTRIITGSIACAALCAITWIPKAEPMRTLPIVNQEAVVARSPSKTVTTSEDKELAVVNLPKISSSLVEENSEAEAVPAATVLATKPNQAQNPDTPPAPQSDVTTNSADPYHTDVYPNNVYSERLLYDAEGNLIGKTITYPCAFGSDTIWIDGHAFYELPGFGLVEWSGPNQVTEDYTMYESGVKVGIMGGEGDAPADSTPTALQATGEEIDQTIHMVPEKNSTPPDYKPVTTPSENG